MNMRQFRAFLLAFILTVCSACFVYAEPEASQSETKTVQETEEKATFPEPNAKAAILYDLKGGRVIYDKNSTEKNYPASLTKIMTALIALENGTLSDVLTVSDTALADITYLHSKLGLKVGEEMTLENLLTALLVCSANDAANVIAEYIAGDIPTFVILMNERAAELGMTGTNYVNPHGFHDDNHYSTAADIAIVTKEAMKNTTFCDMVKIKTAKIPATNLNEERTISSTNHLISRYRNTFHYYPYATGVKTGSTDEAGSCLVATAEKNGVSLLSVVLGCKNENDKELAHSFTDTKDMFEYIFNNYKTATIATTSDIISDSKVYEAKNSTRVALSPSKDVVVLLPKDYKEQDIKPEIKLSEDICAPIKKGVNLGSATYSFGEADALSSRSVTVDLLAANEVKRDHMLHLMHGIGNILFSPFVIIPLILIAVVLLFNAYNRAKRRQERRRRMKSQRAPSYRTNGASTKRRTQSSQNRTRTRQTTAKRRPTSTTRQRRPSNLPPRTPDPWDKYR